MFSSLASQAPVIFKGRGHCWMRVCLAPTLGDGSSSPQHRHPVAVRVLGSALANEIWGRQRPGVPLNLFLLGARVSSTPSVTCSPAPWSQQACDAQMGTGLGVGQGSAPSLTAEPRPLVQKRALRMAEASLPRRASSRTQGYQPSPQEDFIECTHKIHPGFANSTGQAKRQQHR